MYRGQYIPISDFKGGYCGNKSASQLKLNQAADLDNIVLSVDGKGFRTRLGNSKVNGSAINSGAAIHGLDYVLKSDGTTFLMAVSGTKLYAVTTAGSASDVTGSLTITTGSTKLWDMFVFNDAVIGFGGDKDTPDAPWTWDFNTGHNGAALTGSPPSAYGGFTANNRVFAFRTSAAPSSIYWSILASASDWTGTGSGSAVIGSLSDSQKITGACILSTNYALIFKAASTYQMVIQSSPFPVYSLFSEIGCVGKHACINVDGIVYWINQYGRMVSTAGESIQNYPHDADDLWNLIPAANLPDVQAVRQKGVDYDWLVWTGNNGSRNVAIIWDLINKCWLRCSTGYNMTVLTNDNASTVYMSDASGFIYKPSVAATYADASESSPGTIAGFWRTGWMNANSEQVEQIRRVTLEYQTKASGSITVNYGFDFIPDSSSFTLSQVATSTESYATRFSTLAGRGNYIQLKIGQSSSTIDSNVSQILLGGKQYGQKRFTSI